MRSSASTPNPSRSPAPGIALFLRFAGEDHGRHCTGRRLVATGFATATGAARPAGAYALLLDPWAPTPLAPADRARARSAGLLAIDCSWNRIRARGGLPPGLRQQPHRRRLPYLRAANPQHYGRLAELNTAEALAGALHILGEPAQGAALLSGFAGASAFWEINAAAFEAYGGCASPEAVLEAERTMLAGA
ncbi:MAG TPA: DUF367 domain-containing protein [Thermoplasmata archaeon]|nr:DUF367 domain-containing protein [Thermoplasmata archaeon]